MIEFRTQPENQPGRCPSIDPHDTLQCGRKVHEDDQCQFGGIAWKKGTPRYVSPEERLAAVREAVESARGLLEHSAVISSDFGNLVDHLSEILA